MRILEAPRKDNLRRNEIITPYLGSHRYGDIACIKSLKIGPFAIPLTLNVLTVKLLLRFSRQILKREEI